MVWLLSTSTLNVPQRITGGVETSGTKLRPGSKDLGFVQQSIGEAMLD